MKTCRTCNAPLGPEDERCAACGAEVLNGTVVERDEIETVSADGIVETVLVRRTPVPEDLRAALAGRYDLIEGIGQGGMGDVYRGIDRKTDEMVAIKVLKRKYSADPDFAARFMREAKILEALDHPNIVRLMGSGEAEEYLYFAMPFISGRTLRARLREEGKLDPLEAARIAREVCRGLEYAHDKQVIHRDIKPDNIMEDGKGRVYLTDFGISKAAAESTMTQTGAFMGTPEYMSPEQCGNSKDVDGRSDLYSLGIVLYEMLTGRVPFTGDIPSLMHSHVYEKPKPVRRLNGKVPKGLARIVKKLLEKERGKRPAGAHALEWELALFRKREEERREKLKKPEGRLRRLRWYARMMPWWAKAATAIAALFIACVLFALWPETEPKAGEVRTVGGMEFVYIPSGSFMMGQPDPNIGCTGCSKNEQPRHRVTVDGFWMGKYEVTQGQYEAVMGANPSYFKGDGRRPVEQVSWYDAVEFCNRLSEKAGLIRRYTIDRTRRDPNNKNQHDDTKRWTVSLNEGANGFRLPAEAEWEYAARAGSTTAYYWGDNVRDACRYANVLDRACKSKDPSWPTIDCNDGYADTAPVGRFMPNAFGLYDMIGNVWEWCADWYDENYYARSPEKNPKGPESGQYRVLRGGSCYYYDYVYRSDDRLWYNPDYFIYKTGFRVVVPAGAGVK